MNIILFTEEELQAPLPLKDPRARHIRKVLRLGKGDTVHIGLINGPRGTAHIVDINERGLWFNCHFSDNIPQLHPVTMLIGLPRPRSARRILKDVTTQGASELHFVATEMGEKSYLHSNLWQDKGYMHLLREGAEQAFCTRLPKVEVHPSLKHYLNQLDEDTDRLALDNYEATAPLRAYSLQHKRCILAVGSERGWSDTEREQLRTHQFTLVSIGERVLKTETACIAGLAITLEKFGII